jgi:hypothetical protein
MKTLVGTIAKKDLQIELLSRQKEGLGMLVIQMLDYIGQDLGLTRAEQVYGEQFAKILKGDK